MLAFDDGAIARILIGATRFERDDQRTALLRRFVYAAERRPPEHVSGADKSAPENRPRSPDARERMRRYRERLRRQVAIVGVPVTGAVIHYLVRERLLPNKEVHARDEIGRAIAAALEHLARHDR
jgi:MoxR-like ATPase